MRNPIELAKKTVSEFFRDDCPTQAAALSYYTVFSLPPLLLIVIVVAGWFFGAQAVQGKIEEQVAGLIGADAGRQLQGMVQHASRSSASGVAAFYGLLALIFAATTAFAQLQGALNTAWEVKPDPNRGDVRNFLIKRVLSFGMILGVAFLLLVSLSVSAALAAFGEQIARFLPAGISASILQGVNLGISLAVITLLFAAIFKILPDAKIEWRDVWVGAVATALLFTVGKSLVGFYLGNSNVTTGFGAAGSLAIIFLWTYYASMLVLLGAEFTQVWAQHDRREVPPEEGAVHVRKEELVEA